MSFSSSFFKEPPVLILTLKFFCGFFESRIQPGSSNFKTCGFNCNAIFSNSRTSGPDLKIELSSIYTLHTIQGQNLYKY